MILCNQKRPKIYPFQALVDRFTFAYLDVLLGYSFTLPLQHEVENICDHCRVFDP